MSIWISWWGFKFIFIFYLILQCPFSFFLLSNKKKEKVRKRKKNPSSVFYILTSIHSFGCVSLFGYAESLQPRKLGHSPQTMLGKKLVFKYCRASSEATSEAKSAGLPAWRIRLSWSEHSCEDVRNICVFSFFSFAVSFLSLPRK